MTPIPLAYPAFERLICEEKIYLSPSLPFSAICQKLGVDERSFDDFLRSELGYGGEEILSRCRNVK